MGSDGDAQGQTSEREQDDEEDDGGDDDLLPRAQQGPWRVVDHLAVVTGRAVGVGAAIIVRTALTEAAARHGAAEVAKMQKALGDDRRALPLAAKRWRVIQA